MVREVTNCIEVATFLYNMPVQTIVKVIGIIEWLYIVRNPFEYVNSSWVRTFTVDEILHTNKNRGIAKADIRHIIDHDGILVLVIDNEGEE